MFIENHPKKNSPRRGDIFRDALMDSEHGTPTERGILKARGYKHYTPTERDVIGTLTTVFQTVQEGLSARH